MDIKVLISIFMFTLVAIAMNYEVKSLFYSIDITIKSMLISLALSSILSFTLRRKVKYQNALLIIQIKGSFICNHIYFWVGGLFIGAVTGYNISIIYESSQKLTWPKFSLLFSHCLISLLTVYVLFAAEIIRPLRNSFPTFFKRRDEHIQMKEFLSSLPCFIVMGEFVGIMCLFYSGFVIFLVYFAYQAYVAYPLLAYIGIGLFCLLNIASNMFRYLYLRPKYKIYKDEDEFRSIFNEIVLNA